MSGRIKGITVEIGGDVTKLDKALKEVNNEIKDTQSQLKDVERLLKLDPTNTELLAQKQQLLTQAVEDTGRKLEALKQAEKQAQEQFQRGDITQAQYQGLQREIISTEQKLKDLQEQAAQSNVVLQQISAVGEKFQAAGETIAGVGEKLLPVTAAVGGLAAAAVTTAADFDAAMSQVAAVSGAVGDELEALREKAREMGSKTKFSASEAAEAMNYMAMAGWKTKDMLSGIEGIMNLAAASGEDLATTSDIVTDALTAFGLSAEDSGHFADILAAASSNANTNVSMMGETFKYAAPVAGALGYSAEDAALAIGLMANAGIKGSQAGSALRSIITNMSNPTDDMALAMQTLGVSLEDSEGNMYSLMEVMQQLRQGFGEGYMSAEDFSKSLVELDGALADGEIDQELYDKRLNRLMVSMYGAEGAEKAMYASMLAGKYSMSGLLALVGASDKDFNELSGAIAVCSDTVDGYRGVAEHMAAVMQDNLTGQMTILKSQLEELAISFGEMLMPMIRAVVSAVQGFVDKLNSMDEGTRQTIITVLAIAAALGPLLIVIGNVISSVGTVMTILPKLSGALTALTGPVGITVAAIAGIIAILVLLWNNCEGFRDAVTAAWEFIKAAFSGFLDWFQTTFAMKWEALVGAAQTIFQTFQEALAAAWDAILSIFQIFTDFLQEAFGVTWEDVFTSAQGVMETVGGAIQTVVGVLTDIFGGLVAFIAGEFLTRFKTTLNTLIEFFSAIKDGIVQHIDGIKTAFQGIIDFIAGIFTGDWERAWQGVQNIFKGIFEALVGIAKAPINGIIGLINSAINAVNGFIGGINSALGMLSNFGVNIQIPELGHITYMAKGGTLEAGSAIVGEKGPELLSLINGKARVTPLTDSGEGQSAAASAAGAGSYNQILNFYTAAMTPAEVARQTRNATRQMIAKARR